MSVFLKGGLDFYLIFSFERLMPGKLIDYIVILPRVIGGGTRNTPTIPIIENIKKSLLNTNVEKIVHDPFVKPIDYDTIKLTRDLDKAIINADGLIIVTNHNMYKNLDLIDIKQKMRISIIIDGRNMLDKKLC